MGSKCGYPPLAGYNGLVYGLSSKADPLKVSSESNLNQFFVSPSTVRYSPAACKAWVCFNGATGLILNAYGVTAVTRHGIGDYTLTFSEMPNVNYVVNASCRTDAGGRQGIVYENPDNPVRTTTQLRLYCGSNTGSSLLLGDGKFISAAIFAK